MILDVCCSAEKMYHGHQNNLDKNEFITMDIRHGDFSYTIQGATTPVIVKPVVLGTMQHLPFKSNTFDIIVCDPPHMDCGLTGFMSKAWGSWNQRDTIDVMKLANHEFARCLKKNGTLVLKITGDIEDRYIKMLSNFILFLPIQTIRAEGFIKTKKMKMSAKWFIGICNK